MAKRRDLTTYDYRKKRARFLAESDVCHICGHAGAAEQARQNPPQPAPKQG